MTKKIIFIADAHLTGLGDPNMAKLAAFLDLLKGVERIVMLGDIFDFWTGENRVAMSEYAPLLESLERLKERGIQVTFVEGNHDFSMGEFFTDTLKADVHVDSCEFEIDGKRVYLAHGDAVRMTFGYRLWRGFLRSAPFGVLTKILSNESVWAIANFLSRRSRARAKGGYGGAKTLVERSLRKFAERKLDHGYDACVLGHSHSGGVHAGLGKNKAGVYANPGGWINDKSYLEYERGEFKLKKFKGRI